MKEAETESVVLTEEQLDSNSTNVEGHLGGSVGEASAFSSGCDLRVLGSSPTSGSLLSEKQLEVLSPPSSLPLKKKTKMDAKMPTYTKTVTSSPPSHSSVWLVYFPATPANVGTQWLLPIGPGRPRAVCIRGRSGQPRKPTPPSFPHLSAYPSPNTYVVSEPEGTLPARVASESTTHSKHTVEVA